jgi:hypothetical protein
MTTTGPTQKSNAKSSRRERANALAALIREQLESGSWFEPEDDLAVLELAQAAHGMSDSVRGTLRPRFGRDAKRVHAALYSGELDDELRGSVFDLFEEQGLRKFLGRALSYQQLVSEATHALLANPLSIDSVYPRSGFPRLAASIIGATIANRSQLPGVQELRQQLQAWRVPMDPGEALRVLARALRDRERYATAVTHIPAARSGIPLIIPGNLHDHGHETDYFRRVGHAILGESALDVIGALGPIIEVGSGLGYHARLLSERGVTVHATDLEPSPVRDKGGLRRAWTEVRQAPATVAHQYSDGWTLLLIWPPHDTPMAFEALQAFRGNRLVYVGERQGGASADDRFFDTVASDWQTERVLTIPRWVGRYDEVTVYRRCA